MAKHFIAKTLRELEDSDMFALVDALVNAGFELDERVEYVIQRAAQAHELVQD